MDDMIGRDIILQGYDVVASALCDHGHVVVLNNNSSHFLVVQTDAAVATVDQGKATLCLTTGRLIASFNYDTNWLPAFKSALDAMVENAMTHTSDGNEYEEDTCESR